jgi:hypothetical protein
MKRVLMTGMLIVSASIATVNAQQISVVAPGGTTTLYTDLNLAIKGAAAGSTIYLSGGGFQISNNDSSKITKKLTIIGIGHRPDNDNADGSTIVSGRFFFDVGSDNSALMGVYLSGNVDIGISNGNAVNNILVRYCNVNSIQVWNSNCKNIEINQNYIRSQSSGGYSAVSFTNNILYSLESITGGIIDHNVLVYGIYGTGGISNSQLKNNIMLYYVGGGSVVTNNMFEGNWGDNCVTVTDWNDVLVGPNNGVNPTSNFHLKGTQGKNAATDGTDIGIYGGTGFSDTALPPVPRIVSKSVPEQTDENGKLNIQVRIKAQ